mgnify:CR=1 FL=1
MYPSTGGLTEISGMKSQRKQARGDRVHYGVLIRRVVSSFPFCHPFRHSGRERYNKASANTVSARRRSVLFVKFTLNFSVAVRPRTRCICLDERAVSFSPSIGLDFTDWRERDGKRIEIFQSEKGRAKSDTSSPGICSYVAGIRRRRRLVNGRPCSQE